MEQEVNMKMVCIVTQSSEKVSQVFFDALKKFVASQNNKKSIDKNTKEPVGKMVKVKDLRKDGSQVECEKIGPENMKDFRKYARKYGVAYSMEKKPTTPPTYMIYFKAKDSILIRKALYQYVGDKMAEDKDAKDKGVSTALVEAKDKVSKQPKKVRNKEHIR